MELNDDELDERGTEEWTNSIDRGGLWHVSENAYNSFYFIEDEIRHHLLAAKVDKMTVGTQSKLVNAVIEGEDVQFQWCITTAMAADESTLQLLKMIVELYVTIRAFAFAESCLEL